MSQWADILGADKAGLCSLWLSWGLAAASYLSWEWLHSWRRILAWPDPGCWAPACVCSLDKRWFELQGTTCKIVTLLAILGFALQMMPQNQFPCISFTSIQGRSLLLFRACNTPGPNMLSQFTWIKSTNILITMLLPTTL